MKGKQDAGKRAVMAALREKRGGSHGPSTKAQRKRERQALRSRTWED